jgi:acyl-coenzyme A synthetase/AMP-(fatty) acid ligase
MDSFSRTTLNLGNVTGMLVSPSTFDPAIIEMCLPFMTQGTLVLPDKIFQSIQNHHVTLFMTTPALFQMLTMEQQMSILSGKTSVQTLCLGGEPFPMQLFDSQEWNIQVWNMYGTTECR